MKNLAVAAFGTALVLSGSAGWAAGIGGIQIDPTGSGSIAGSKFISGAGNTGGNMLGDDVLAGSGANGGPGGTVLAHNAFALGSFGISGAELSFELSMPVTAALTGPAATVGTVLGLVQSGAATLDLWFDPTADASEASGLGYGGGGDAVHLATGSVTLGSTFSFSNISGGPTGAMAANNATPSIAGNGSTVFVVDFIPASLNTSYVVNDLASLVIDLATSNALTLQYGQAPFPVVFASASFAGGAVTPGFGPDGVNDFACGGLVLCDIQMQMNTTMVFTAPRVPEPTTLALLGAGLGLFGISRRRKNRC